MKPRAYVNDLCVFFIAILSASCAYSQDTVSYGGVEIGAGGVKAINLTFETKLNGTWAISERRPKDFEPQLESIPYGLVAAGFSDKVVDDVGNVTALILQKMPKEIPLNRRFVVISSGAIDQAKRLDKLDAITFLESRIAKLTGINAERISVTQEVEFAFLDVTRGLPLAQRQTTLLIDIGSGNTKFGAYRAEKFVCGEISRGIASELKRFKDLQSAQEIQVAMSSLKKIVSGELREERRRVGLQEFEPQTTYLLGGAVFSMMAHCQPGDLVAESDQTPAPEFATIQVNSVENYRKWVIDQSNNAPDLNNLKGIHRDRAEKRAELSRKVISLEQRRPSLVFIESIFDSFALDRQSDLKFPVDGQYAWLRGYINSKAQQK